MSFTDRTDSFVASLGHPAWRVGGSVRDELMHRRSKDGDYVMRASLPALHAALKAARARPTLMEDRRGRKLGYRARHKGTEVEIVLPRAERKIKRVDGDIGNERHAFDIVVDPTLPLAEDALRRDFRFNAIYIDVHTREVVDPLDGITDLEDKTIRTTHPDSFADDPLRILRALRFVSTLGFTLSGGCFDQMVEHAPAMAGGLTDKGVSGTALDELCKLLMGDNVAKALRYARDTGALVSLIPELGPMIGFGGGPYHDFTIDEHTFVAIDAAARMGCSLRVRLALLFHDAGKPEACWVDEDGFQRFYGKDGTEDHAVISARLARKFLVRVNADKKLRRDVPIIIENHMIPLSMKVKPTKVRKWRCQFGDEMLADLFKHRLADCMGKGTISYEAISAIARMEKIREDAVDTGVPASAKDLKDKGLIDGRDLIGMGIEGEKIGKVLETLLHEVVSQPERAEREWLLGRAKKVAGRL